MDEQDTGYVPGMVLGTHPKDHFRYRRPLLAMVFGGGPPLLIHAWDKAVREPKWRAYQAEQDAKRAAAAAEKERDAQEAAKPQPKLDGWQEDASSIAVMTFPQRLEHGVELERGFAEVI